MTLTDPLPPTFATIPIQRIRDGEVITTELLVSFEPRYYTIPAKLVIAGGWVVNQDGRGEFVHWDRYDVRAIGLGTYRLIREANKLLTLPPGGDRRQWYDVFIGRMPEMDRCECRGFMESVKNRLVCKHISATRHFAESGLFTLENVDG